MSSKHIRADFNVAWPTAEVAVMGPEGAVNIIFRSELEEADDPDARRAELIADYKERFANPYHAAERGYVDEVIEPRRTRPVLISALETALAEARAAAEAQARQHSALEEADLAGLADPAVADCLVDPVRGRVREVGVQEAEHSAGGEPIACHSSGDRAAVASAAALRRRVHRADAAAARRRTAEAGERHRAAVLPDDETGVVTAQARVDHALVLRGVGRVFT